MSWRRFLHRSEWDRERSAELDSYLRIETDENLARGMDPAAARDAAHKKLGNRTLVREEIYRMNTLAILDTLARDLRYALRGMRRDVAFTVMAVLTLALGIGATTAVFSVVNGVLIKPLPYPDPDALVAVWHSAVIPGGARNFNQSGSMYVTYLENNRTFQEYGVWNNGASNITGLDDPEQVRTFQVTYGVLRAFGVRPELGRWFTEADDSPATPETVILMHGYWQRRFGGDPGILGRSITVDSRPRQVIGVMPQNFQLNGNPEIVLPLRFDRAQIPPTFAYVGLARLKPGVSIAQANADVERMIPIWIEQWGMQRFANFRISGAIRPFKDEVVGDVRNVLWVVMGTIAIILLIACANVANLMLVRAEGRRQELAIRAALGAGARRIARELLVESMAFAALGGAAGLAIAYGGLSILAAIGPASLPRLSEISIDPQVLAFTACVSLAAGIGFALIPVLKFAKAETASSLRSGGRSASPSRERQRSQNTLAVVQVALALVLLAGSGLMIRSFRALRGVHPGFTGPERVESVRIAIPAAEVADPEAVTRIQAAIVDRLAAIPGVESASMIDGLPMDLNVQSSSPVSIEGQPDNGTLPPVRRVKFVAPGAFRTLGIPLLAGRDFTWQEIHDKREVAVVSESMARQNWGDPRSALGKRLREGASGSWREVIGVAGDIYDDGANKPPPVILYWPARVQQISMGVAGYVPRSMAFALRSSRTGTESLLRQIQEAVWSVNRNLPLAEVRTLRDVYDQSMVQTSFTLVMLAIAGAMALGLGIIGIYGVLSYAVSRRRREAGIRLVLGAQQRQVQAMFLKRGLAIAGVGVVFGLAAAAGLTRLMASVLFGVRPLDPVTYAAVPLILVLAAGFASYIPARRAAKVHPAEALRSE